MKKLWDKSDTAHPLVVAFTVGLDWKHDNAIIYFDCIASIAHAKTLHKISVINDTELNALQRALQSIITECDSGTFSVTAAHEDCHTAIEQRLIELCGAVGKKIHSGRSRNDQVFTALLLYGRENLFHIVEATQMVVQALLHVAQREEFTPMMGRTHLQNAMPSTVGMWAAAYSEQFLSTLELFDALYAVTNRSPLGSAAGYGSPLPLDRDYSAQLLAFERPIQTMLAAANSRGHWEAYYLDSLTQITMIISRLAQDLMLFTLPEIGYFQLPDNLCTGSSIMPHKKNPDVLELLRAKSAALIGAATQVKQIMHALPGGYNRDVQEIKPIFIAGIAGVNDALPIVALVMQSLIVHRDALQRAIDPKIFSVDTALHLAQERGIPFRDAYFQVADQIDTVAAPSYRDIIASRSSFGALGNIGIDALTERSAHIKRKWNARKTAVTEAFTQLRS